MTVSYSDVANVLDAVADYVDGIEFAKVAVKHAATTERIQKFAEKYEVSTGEQLPSSLRDKLAGLDPDTLDHLLKVSNNTEGSPDSLGSPSELLDRRQPSTVKEAAVQAEESFLNWIVNE